MRIFASTLLLLAALFGGAAFYAGGPQSALQLVTAINGPTTTAKPPESKRPPVPVETEPVRRETLSDDLFALGTLEPDEAVDIAPEIGGRIAQILFKDGEPVARGAVMFRLAGDLLEAERQDTEARLRLAETTFERNQRLSKSGIAARQSLDEAQTNLAVARAALELLEARVAKLEIKAPFDGIADLREVSEGAYVAPGTRLVRLRKMDRLKVMFSLPERYMSRVALGQAVTLETDAVPGLVARGDIDAVAPAAEAATRSLKLRATIRNDAFKLKPGLLARITVKGEAREALTVAESAIVPRGSGSIVYIVVGGKAKEMRVETGRRQNGRVEILGGLKGGEAVVIAGHQRLRNDAAVEIVGGAES
jgi:membrane fusion protein (multidrug efflux system)